MQQNSVYHSEVETDTICCQSYATIQFHGYHFCVRTVRSGTGSPSRDVAECFGHGTKLGYGLLLECPQPQGFQFISLQHLFISFYAPRY